VRRALADTLARFSRVDVCFANAGDSLRVDGGYSVF
jgi:hypothetical protein